MSIAIALSAFGLYVIYTNKNMSRKNHFTTTHAKVGLFVLIGFFGVGLFGGVFLHPGQLYKRFVVPFFIFFFNYRLGTSQVKAVLSLYASLGRSCSYRARMVHLYPW